MFSDTEIAGCTDSTWTPQTSRPATAIGHVYIGADYGWKFDFSAVAAVCQLRNGPAALLDGRLKGGTRKQPVPEAWILEIIEELLLKFGYCKVALDPTNLRHVIDKLRGRVEIIEMSHKKPTITTALRRFISERKFRMYPNAMMAEWPHEPGRVLTLQSILRHVQ